VIAGCSLLPVAIVELQKAGTRRASRLREESGHAPS
jgi:hypothetical protein